MSDRKDALQATTSDLIADATELQAIEHRKASLEPDDARQDHLAVEAQEIVRGMVSKAAAQREIVAGPEDWPGDADLSSPSAPGDRDLGVEPA